jgi:hypothetical protein
MEPVRAVSTFLKLQTAFNKVKSMGIRLRSLRSKGNNDFGCRGERSATNGVNNSKEVSVLEAKVEELYQNYSENHLFCCGGDVTLLEHDIRSLVVKLLDVDMRNKSEQGNDPMC